MTEDTPEQRKAQHDLDNMVQEFLNVHGWNDTGVLTAYALVCHVGGAVGDDGSVKSGYPIIYLGSECPDHVAEGLFRMGLDRIHYERYQQMSEEE